METVYHIAKDTDWKDAQKKGYYDVSTLNKTLKEVGFIHLSFANQVNRVADFIYKNECNLKLLKIDPNKLESKIVVESIEGTKEKFPHLYGKLNLDAVDEIKDYKLLQNGKFPVVL
jgi:glutathione S-transferase